MRCDSIRQKIENWKEEKFISDDEYYFLITSLVESIDKYDNPQIHGKTGLRDYQNQKSLYCSRTQVKKAFKDLILKAKVKYIFLSYNNEGLMTIDDIKEIMSLRGKYGYFTKEYNRFKADKSENRNYKANKTLEYLHYVVCK